MFASYTQIQVVRTSVILLAAASITFITLTSGCKTDSKSSQGPAGTNAANPASVTLDAVAISQLRERSLAMLTQATNSDSAEIRANAVEALAVVPARLAPILPRMLADTNPGVRAVSAKVAGRTKLTQVAGQLTALTGDSVTFVRAAAIYALVRMGQPIDQTPLAQMLFSPDPVVRAEAAFFIGEIGSRSALPMVKEASARGMPRIDAAIARKVQLQIAEALVKLGDDGAVQEIRAGLYPSQEKDYENAALAAQILGQLNDKASGDQLIYITAYKEGGTQTLPAEVRLAAASALARLGNDRGSFIADEYAGSVIPALRAQTAFVYGATGRLENLSKLKPLLEDNDPLVRIAAAAAVVKLAEK